VLLPDQDQPRRLQEGRAQVQARASGDEEAGAPPQRLPELQVGPQAGGAVRQVVRMHQGARAAAQQCTNRAEEVPDEPWPPVVEDAYADPRGWLEERRLAVTVDAHQLHLVAVGREPAGEVERGPGRAVAS